jgi:hypothetical protein
MRENVRRAKRSNGPQTANKDLRIVEDTEDSLGEKK